jgi:hypothetical protein
LLFWVRPRWFGGLGRLDGGSESWGAVVCGCVVLGAGVPPPPPLPVPSPGAAPPDPWRGCAPAPLAGLRPCTPRCGSASGPLARLRLWTSGGALPLHAGGAAPLHPGGFVSPLPSGLRPRARGWTGRPRRRMVDGPGWVGYGLVRPVGGSKRSRVCAG